MPVGQVSFDDHESRGYLGATIMTATETGQTTGGTTAVLCIGVKKYILPLKMADPMQNGPGIKHPPVMRFPPFTTANM